MTLTYEQMLERVIARLDSDGADSEREWAMNILASIGITQPTIQTVALTNTPLKHPMMPMPCCERTETRGPNCFIPRNASEQDQNQVMIEADAEEQG